MKAFTAACLMALCLAPGRGRAPPVYSGETDSPHDYPTDLPPDYTDESDSLPDYTDESDSLPDDPDETDSPPDYPDETDSPPDYPTDLPPDYPDESDSLPDYPDETDSPSAPRETDALSDEFIDSINRMQDLWVAGRNFAPDTPRAHLARLACAGLGGGRLPRVEHAGDEPLPESFHPRDKWSGCPSFDDIRDQSACGSCWAFGAVSAITDRYCTYSNGTRQVHVSAEDMLACSGAGTCGGALYTEPAWQFWVSEGLVTGGNYNSSEGCLPYTLPTCMHLNEPGKYPKCVDLGEPETPKCVKKCRDGYGTSYENDKHFGENSYSLKGEKSIMAEVYKNGPVEVGFIVYQDFFTYKSGVYKHVAGRRVGGHAVKLLGWGVERGTKYWLIANSWNETWGDGGFSKILRGENECNIESNALAGKPKL